jgi:outer membrane receptor for ferrienterochelin and colicins
MIENKRSGIIAVLGVVALQWLVVPEVVAAAEQAPEDDPLQALLSVLEQETEIATRTKMNIDFVPGMVSVLYGEDLVAKGFDSVGEAMSLIPGVELSLSSDGQGQLFVRGIGTSFSSGKVKMLLNGVPYNSTLSVASTVFRLPVEQVERIEVIRGPGSAIYGEFAFSGVVNVITRKSGNSAFARYSSLGDKSVGAVLSHEIPEQDWRVSLNFSGTNIQGDEVKAGPDVLRGTPITRAPGPTNEIEHDRSLLLHTGYRDMSLSVQWMQVDSGDYFGLANALPAPDPEIVRKVRMLSVEMEQQLQLTADLDARFHLGWLEYQLDSGLHQLYPPGFMGSYPNGVIGSPNYEERKSRLAADVNYTGMANHDWVAGVEWLYTNQGDTYALRNYDPVTFAPVPLAEYRGSESWLADNLSRRSYGIFVQDQYAYNDQLTLTGGLRYDTYDDVGDAISPRIAAVYQLKEHQTLKVQFARAFRPPTFLETSTQNNPIVTGSGDIESEHIDNYEVGFIFNDGASLGRATLFYADLHDLIVIDSVSHTYVNQGEVHVTGAELEFARQFGRELKLDGSLSLMDAEDKTGNTKVSDVADIIGDLGIMYRPSKKYSMAFQMLYVGDRKRAPGDPRSDLDGYTTVNLTFTAESVLPGMNVHAGVKNLFDEDVIYPSPMVSFGGSVLPAYPQDYPRPGQELWLQADYRF